MHPRTPEHIVRAIRARLRNGERVVTIARALGVNHAVVSRIKNRRRGRIEPENVEFVPQGQVSKYLSDGWTPVPDQNADWAVLMYRPENVATLVIGA